MGFAGVCMAHGLVYKYVTIRFDVFYLPLKVLHPYLFHGSVKHHTHVSDFNLQKIKSAIKSYG